MAQNHLSRCQFRCQTITRSLEMTAHNSDVISIACHCRGSSQLLLRLLRQSHNQSRKRTNSSHMHSQGNAALACFLKKGKSCAYFCCVSKSMCSTMRVVGEPRQRVARASCVQFLW